MNLDHKKVLNNAPPGPRISPQDSPLSQIQKIDFELQTPSFDLNQDSIRSFYSEEEPTPSSESLEMIDQEEQIKNIHKRSYQKFMGLNYSRVTISQTLSFVYCRPRKRLQTGN